jgi:hypothetical protein
LRSAVVVSGCSYYIQCAITISGTLFNCPAQQFWGLEKPTAAAAAGPQLFQVVKLYTTQKKSSSAKA